MPRTEVPRCHDLRFHDATVASVHMDQFWPTKWIFLSPHTQRYIVPTRSIEAIASAPICSIPSRAPVSWCSSPFQTAPLIQQPAILPNTSDTSFDCLHSGQTGHMLRYRWLRQGIMLYDASTFKDVGVLVPPRPRCLPRSYSCSSRLKSVRATIDFPNRRQRRPFTGYAEPG